MSGEVVVSRECPWGHIVLRQGIRRSIAVRRLPDGTVRGPAEYFAKVQKRFEAAMDQAMPKMVAHLESCAESLGLLRSGQGVKIELEQLGHRNFIEASLRGERRLTEAEKQALWDALQAIVDSQLSIG